MSKSEQTAPWFTSLTARISGLLLAGVVGFAAIFGLGGVPSPSGKDVPPGKFSSGRALEYTRHLLGPGEKPHPPGSLANAAVRKRLLGKLKGLGLTPQVQTRWACSPYHFLGCTRVHNVLARIEGKQKGPAVAVSAHYDSIAASPGASDDVAGVGALLEMARVLLRKAPHRNPIVLLITDGEESGLTGAVAFEKHPWSSQIAAVVNLEASGTSGLSNLFQTGPRNGWVIDLFTRHAPRPTANSMLPVLLTMSGNITDFDRHKKRGIDGANFAYGGNPQHYHTPLDDLAHLNEGSLRHQGENALALLRALAQTDLSKRPEGARIYQDIAGRVLVSWSTSKNLSLVLLALLLFAGLCVLAARRELWAWEQALYGVGLACLAGVLAGALGFAVQSLLSVATGHPKPWWAISSTFTWLYALVAVTAMLASMRLLGQRFEGWSGWLGVWGLWGLLTLLVALVAPAFSALFVLPLFAALLCGLAALVLKSFEHPPLALPWLATLLLWLPAIQLANGIGYNAFNGLVVWIALLPWVPLARRLVEWPHHPKLLLVAVAATGLLVVLAMLQPRADKEHPIGINIVTVQDADSPHSRTQLEVMWHFSKAPTAVLPKALAKGFKLGLFPGHYGTGGYGGFAGYVEGPAFKAPAPTARMNPERTQLTLQSQRGASIYHICISTHIQVLLPGGVRSGGTFNMEPKSLQTQHRKDRDDQLRVHRFYGPAKGPLVLQLRPKANKKKAAFALWVGDVKAGVAKVAIPFAKQRGPFGVPNHHGDRSIVGAWVLRPGQSAQVSKKK